MTANDNAEATLRILELHILLGNSPGFTPAQACTVVRKTLKIAAKQGKIPAGKYRAEAERRRGQSLIRVYDDDCGDMRPALEIVEGIVASFNAIPDAQRLVPGGR